ncbi:MAG: alpha/beta fold hydrolase [Pseudomonadota bacterium]
MSVRLGLLVLALGLLGASASAEQLTTTTADGITIHGEPYLRDLPPDSPLVVLFHMGGSSARGEYGQIGPWLNEAGFRAVAWDLRGGGDRLGVANRTVEAPGTPELESYCDAYPEIVAAVDHAITTGLADRAIVWGSSYTASLIFRLAAEAPEKVAGLVAFSPASGGPMVDCRARMWVEAVEAPMLVYRPEREMAREPSVEQKQILEAAGVEFHVLANGVHGSPMLLDDKTGHDMSAARKQVLAWLHALEP